MMAERHMRKMPWRGSCVLGLADASANGKQVTEGCWEDELNIGSWELNPEPHTY